MTEAEVDDRMQQVFRDIFADDDLTVGAETTAADIEGWDSLAHINLMFALEAEFGVQFTDDQLTSFRNVGQLRDFLVKSAR